MKTEITMSKETYAYLRIVVNEFEDVKIIESATEVEANNNFVKVKMNLTNAQRLWSIARSAAILMTANELLRK